MVTISIIALLSDSGDFDGNRRLRPARNSYGGSLARWRMA